MATIVVFPHQKPIVDQRIPLKKLDGTDHRVLADPEKAVVGIGPERTDWPVFPIEESQRRQEAVTFVVNHDGIRLVMQVLDWPDTIKNLSAVIRPGLTVARAQNLLNATTNLS